MSTRRKIMNMVKKVQGVCNSITVTIIIAATIVAGLSVGYGTIPACAQEPVTLEFWCDKVGYITMYEDIFEDFTDETGIKIVATGFYDIEGYIGTIKTLIGKPEAPDVFTWWTGKTMEELANTGGLMDLSFAFDANPGAEAVKDVMTVEGVVVAVPQQVSIWAVTYNKSVFKEVGIEPPETWDEFLELCRKIKEAGITPFGGGWDSWQGFIWPGELVPRIDPDYYELLNAGKASYTDPQMKQAAQIIIEMAENGYFGDPNYVLTLASPTEVPTSIRILASGEAAMIYYGDWISGFLTKEGFTDWGMFCLPNVNPALEKQSVISEPAPFLANKATKHPEEVRKFFEWWMSPETIMKWCRIMNWTPWNVNCSKEFLPPEILNFHKSVEERNPRYLLRYWEAAPTKEFDVRGMLISAAQEILVHPEKLDTLLAGVQESNKSYWEKYGFK